MVLEVLDVEALEACIGDTESTNFDILDIVVWDGSEVGDNTIIIIKWKRKRGQKYPSWMVKPREK